MTDKEARQVLGLPISGALDKAKVEAAFNSVFRVEQAKANACIGRDEREKYIKVLGLLQQAKSICLGTGGAGRQTPATNSSAASAPGPGNGRQGARSAYGRGRRGTGSLHNAASDLADVFVHLWECLKSLFRFLVAIPAAVVEIKDFVCDVLDHLQTVGIPKLAVIGFLVIGLLPLVQGCVQMVQKVEGWFK